MQAKGQNFTCVFCVGSFFPNDGSACPEWDEYKTGAKPVPITTYILGPSNVAESKFYAGMDNGGELCDNVVCLGRCGIYKVIIIISVPIPFIKIIFMKVGGRTADIISVRQCEYRRFKRKLQSSSECCGETEKYGG